MCGIIGIIGKGDVAHNIVDGLKHLEYRGYDSAGVATIHDGEIVRCRSEGKIARLQKKLKKEAPRGSVGIGHTRWATHGAPNTNNAHPHSSKKVAVVHNGIIENFLHIRDDLKKKGYKFHTDTDTEVIPQLITYYLDQGQTPENSVRKAVKKLEGAYALGIIFSKEEEIMIACRQGSPLSIGYGDGQMYLGSDSLALAPFTSKISYLEDGDVAVITRNGANICDIEGKKVKREIVSSNTTNISIGKENYRHFMQKEIHEQPSVIGDSFHAYCNAVSGEITLPGIDFDIKQIDRITIIACGTSYYAGMVAKYWIEKIAKIPVDVDIASEFRYRNAILSPKGLALFISQSGETADTLAALRYTKKTGQQTVAVVNVQESTIAREADVVLPTYCGPEIGVASTKAFTTQLVVLACFTIFSALERGAIKAPEGKKLAHALSEVSSRMAEILNHDKKITELAHDLAMASDILYMGRGTSYGIALEGALKLKEISYIHAEAMAAGELKHGTIALVDEAVPIIALAPSDDLFEKTASNIREVAARGGKVILLSDSKGIKKLKDVAYATINLPQSSDIITPMLYAIPIQLIAYHVAVIKGTDVDQPRNLAKSVTVE